MCTSIEVKYGTVEVARKALEKKVNPHDGKENRLSDKQTKSFLMKKYVLKREGKTMTPGTRGDVEGLCGAK